MANVNFENQMEKETELGDVYVQTENTFGGYDKKGNMADWDSIEGIVENAINEIAKTAGIEVTEWQDYSIIKEATELITKQLEEKFDIDFKFIDENY